MQRPTSPAADNAKSPIEVFYVHTDHLGTPRELTDTTGQIVWAASYKAWGNTAKIEHPPLRVIEKRGNTLAERWQAQSDPIEQNLRFQGQYFDLETGLHYNRFRHYDPDCGRFISQDPIGLAGGTNNYQYAPNPIKWVDPLGLVAVTCKLCCPAGTMDPKDIHFMQNNAKNVTGEYTVLGNAEGLKNGTIDPSIFKIRVWQDATGKIWTLDHRRLISFRLANKCIAVDLVDKNAVRPDEMERKMSTRNGGKSIILKFEDGTRITVE